jgi:hypothetical protein
MLLRRSRSELDEIDALERVRTERGRAAARRVCERRIEQATPRVVSEQQLAEPS